MEQKKGKTSLALIVLAVIALLAVGATYYFYSKYQTAQKIIKDPTALGRQEAAGVIAEVGKVMALPNEQPTIATVTDVTQLKNQPFFKNAKNGDKLLIYPKARKAILWRPSEKKIIETAPVNIGTPQGVPTPLVSGQPNVSPTKAVISPVLSPTIAR